MEEVDQVFGRFWRSDRRMRLTDKLRRFVEEARQSGIVAAVVIDGSYVTAKPEPADIDLIVALRPDFNLAQELRPFEYNIQSKRWVKKTYRFDIRVALDGSALLPGAPGVLWVRSSGRSRARDRPAAQGALEDSAMIQNDEQLNQTREALIHLESAMALLARDKPNIHASRYSMMAEPIVADIRRLRREIEAYIGIDAGVGEPASST